MLIDGDYRAELCHMSWGGALAIYLLRIMAHCLHSCLGLGSVLKKTRFDAKFPDRFMENFKVLYFIVFTFPCYLEEVISVVLRVVMFEAIVR